MRNKELHIWMYEGYPKGKTKVTFKETAEALANGEGEVHTTQTHFCQTRWLKQGYHIVVYTEKGYIEMQLGNIIGCKKEIREAHNLERMLLAGSFVEQPYKKERF